MEEVLTNSLGTHSNSETLLGSLGKLGGVPPGASLLGELLSHEDPRLLADAWRWVARRSIVGEVRKAALLSSGRSRTPAYPRARGISYAIRSILSSRLERRSAWARSRTLGL